MRRSIELLTAHFNFLARKTMNIRLLILFCIIHAAQVTGMEVTFFNVGQGNCTLVTYPGQKTMLVDAGSSKAPLNDPAKTQVVRDIIKGIKEKTPDKQLFVVASHADKDHINLLTSICAPLLKEKFTLEFLLGGTPASYEKKDGKELLAFLEKHKKTCKKTFASDITGDGKTHEKEFSKIVPPYSKVLAAITSADGKKNVDPNDTSIVLKVREGHFSALLPGDATGNVTEPLIKNSRLSLLSSVYELSHHGAETHNATTLPLLLAINPKVLIISSGLFEGKFMHPRFETIKTSIEYCVKRNGAEARPHLLTYQHTNGIRPYKGKADNNRFNVVAINTDGFATAQTTFPIYHTADVGTITCCAQGVSVTTEANVDDDRSIAALKQIHTPRFDGIRFLFFNSMDLESTQLKQHLIALPAALEYLDLRDNAIGHFGIEHLIALYKNHGQHLVVKLADNRLVDKKALTTICKKKDIRAITTKNRILATFSKKGLEKDTLESLEFSRGKASTPPFQDAHAKAYAANHSPKSRAAQKNLFTFADEDTQEITGELSHDEENLYVEYANQQDKNIGFIWPDITDICVLSDKNQTVAGVTTKERSWLFDFANNNSKDLIGKFRYTSTAKPWKTIGKEFWSLDTPGTCYYHERRPFSQNGKFVLTVSAKNKGIYIYQTDQLVFDPEHVKLHKSISEDELKNDLGHTIKDIKRIEFCDADHSIKCHFTDKTSGELRYILEPNEI